MNGTPSQMLVTIAVNSDGPPLVEPGHRVEPDRVERGVDQAELAVEDEPPGEGADERRHRPRQDEQHPVEPRPADRPVEQHREAEAEPVVEDARRPRSRSGVGELQPELAHLAGEHLRRSCPGRRTPSLVGVGPADLRAAEDLGADLGVLVRLVEVGERDGRCPGPAGRRRGRRARSTGDHHRPGVPVLVQAGAQAGRTSSVREGGRS